ncbi:MAG: hypothetical protein GQ540_07695 [Lutibacter sp.]|uniref:polysaccharide (de)acetylase n=1 Tax=Lutibacter sp. TaxID=1925666 RepID=UPI0019E6A2D4|nr:polysaccharide (de)acetylase [Lutibacter sp.]NOR28396.1 hypothetical protein [Lutibacter sp.]
MLNNIKRNISNLPGWRTKRHIIVIESDDWGSIRMSSKENFESLKRGGINVGNNHYNTNDALESNSDLELLMELLSKHKDASGKSVVITGVNIVANPNFEKIKKNGFSKYEYELYTETCKRYPEHDRVHNLWQEGIKQRLLVPEFHGREHVNVQRWMKALQKGCKSTHLAFEHGVTGISSGIHGENIEGYQAAFDIDTLDNIEYQKEVLETGLDCFEQLYGYKATFFVPPNGPFNNNLEKTVKEEGINYLGTGKIQLEPLGNGQFKKHFRYLGKKNNDGLIYMTRNAFFEPNSWEHPQTKDWVNDCLKEIEIAFRWHKPATISSHRTNYIGWLNANNRSNGLKKLDELLKKIIIKWPDVEFMTSSELGDIITKRRQ